MVQTKRPGARMSILEGSSTCQMMSHSIGTELPEPKIWGTVRRIRSSLNKPAKLLTNGENKIKSYYASLIEKPGLLLQWTNSHVAQNRYMWLSNDRNPTTVPTSDVKPRGNASSRGSLQTVFAVLVLVLAFEPWHLGLGLGLVIAVLI